MIPYFLIALFSYLIGSIPFGFVIAKYAYGLDIRTVGSHNIGTTNVFRNLGYAAGVLVLAGDVGKGMLSVWLAKYYIGSDLGMIIAAASVISGHNWPLTLRLRGGKGIATACGALLVMTPLTTVILILVWLGIVLLTKYVSLASITAAAIFPVLTFVLSRDRIGLLVFGVIAASVIIFKHRSNISRLIGGIENKTILIGKRD